MLYHVTLLHSTVLVLMNLMYDVLGLHLSV